MSVDKELCVAGSRGQRRTDHRGACEADQHAPESRTQECCDGHRRHCGGVRLQQLPRGNDLRKRGALRDVEEHEGRAFHQGNDVELRCGQVAQPIGERDGTERQETGDIASDHHRLPIPAVDQRAGREADHHIGAEDGHGLASPE